MVSPVREKIVGAATERFHAVGYTASGVQEIVDLAGVPKGSFYNYFKSKELLALEVLKNYAVGSRREILLDRSIAPLDRLRRHFDFMASRYESFGYSKGCLIGNIAAETSEEMPLIREALDQSMLSWTGAVATAIRDAQADGSVTSDIDAASFSRFLVNSWEGAIVRMKIVGGREPLDDFFSVVFSILAPSPKQA